MPDDGADGRDHHPGRRRRRLVPVRPRGQAQVLLQLLRHRVLHRRPPTSPSPPASTRCGWSSPTTAAGWARAATSRCTTTARPSARAESSRPSRWPSPPTRPATSAPTPARRRHPTTARTATSSPARSTGCSIDIGEDSHDHLHHRRGQAQHRDGAAVTLAIPSAPAGSAPRSARRTPRASLARRPRRVRGTSAVTSSPAPASGPGAPPPPGRRVASEMTKASVSALITSDCSAISRADRPLRGGEPRCQRRAFADVAQRRHHALDQPLARIHHRS